MAGCLLWVGGATAEGAKLPPRFFGIAPQTDLSEQDASLMRSARIGSLRTPVDWSAIEREPGVYDWGGLDHAVERAAKQGIQVLPFFYGTPGWLARDPTILPVRNLAERQAWFRFLQAAVERYGPGGSFWRENIYVQVVPIRLWQIWNEPNFFYFAKPASPKRYATLLKDSGRAIKSVDRGAQVLIGGLFGEPRGRPPRAMPATVFLQRLYRVRGLRRFFDGVALHPYAAGIRRLARISQQVRRVMVRSRDARTGLYITEMGWGSENNRRKVAFEVGWRGQAKVMRNAYRYLLLARRKLNLKQVYWFTWKDASSATCSFCDSAGLFRAGDGFKAKPAWRMFRRVSSGKVRLRPRRKRR